MISSLPRIISCLALVLGIGATVPVIAQSPSGTWRLIVEESDNIDPWRDWTITLTLANDTLTQVRHWRAGRYYQHDSLTVSLDGNINTIPVRAGKWMNHVYLGVFVPEHATRDVTAKWDNDGRLLTVVSVVPLETSQTDTAVEITSEYRFDSDGHRLTLTEARTSRTTGPLHYIFKRQ